MSVTDKYNAVLQMAEERGVTIAHFHEDNGMLVFEATAATPYEVNQLWDKIKECAGLDISENPTDVNANITAADDSVYARHTVSAGETLGKIAKHYYGEAGKYTAIFEANTDILDDPDRIEVDQELVIPHV